MGRFLSLVALFLAAYVGYRWAKREAPSAPSESRVEVERTPNVVVALRRLQRLETAEFAIERVMDVRDKQSRLGGLVQAEDALLLIASGLVSAGIDLNELPEDAILAHWDERTVSVALPAPRVLHAHLDEGRTYVHTRRTDAFAERRETLETDARRAAEAELERAAIEGGLLKMATDNARATVESLLYSLGFRSVTVTFSQAPPDGPK